MAPVGVLSYLARQPDLPGSLLRMLGVFSAPAHTWLVTEFCDGGDLFEVLAAGALRETQVKAHMIATMITTIMNTMIRTVVVLLIIMIILILLIITT